MIGGAGKSGSLSLAAARDAGADAHGRRGAARGRGRPAARQRAGRPRGRGRRPRPDRAARRRRRHRWPGRRHGGLRRRTRLRGWGHPEHGRGRHRHLLLDGDLLLGRRPGRRGPRGRRDHARRQRLHARPRGVRPGAAPRATTASAACSSGGCDGGDDPAPQGRPRPRPGHRAQGPVAGPQGRAADRQDRPAAHDRVGRARDAAAGRSRGRRHRGHAVGQPARRLRPRRRRPRARRRAARLGRRTPRRGRRPAGARREGVRRLGPVPAPGGRRRQARHHRGPPPGRRRDQAHRRAPQGARATDRADRRRAGEALDLPDRGDRRHLRGHPAGAGCGPRGRRRDRGDPVDRAEPARLRARGCDPRGLRRHLRHAGELPADAGGARRDVSRSSVATSG